MADYAAALPVVNFVASAGKMVPRREQMKSFRGFSVQHLLSPTECESIVARARDDVGMKSVDWEYVASYRKCDRGVFSCPTLADELEKRLRPLLELGDLDGIKPFGIGAEGEWVLASPFVNSVFRVASYQEGCGFAKHIDNGFVFSDDLRSILTLVIYLNENFSGGTTAFFPGKKKGQVAEIVTPSTGCGVCFAHDVLHEGREVESGAKWVLRTDVMFQRIETLSVLPFKEDPKWQEAENLYRKSIELQTNGRPAESTASFIAASQIQAELNSARDQMRMHPGVDLTTCLSRDLLSEIASFLSLTEVLNLSVLNSFFRNLIRTSSRLWFEFFRRRWGDATHPRTVAQICSAMGDSVSFFTAFKSRYLAEKTFRICSVNLVSNIACTSGKLFSARVGYAAGHLWCAGSGMFQCATGNFMETDPYDEDFFIKEQCYYGSAEAPEKYQNMVQTIRRNQSFCNTQFRLNEVDSCTTGGFNAVAAAIVCRHSIAVRDGKFPDDDRKEAKDKIGNVPVMLVAAPVAVRYSRDAFYSSLHELIPMCPYVVMISISEVLAHFFATPRCISVIVNDCGATCSVVIDNVEDSDSVVHWRLPNTVFNYPMHYPEDAYVKAGEVLAENADLLNFVVSEVKLAANRTSFNSVILGGIVSAKLAETIEAKLRDICNVAKPPPEVAWQDVHAAAISNFVAAPSCRNLFQALELDYQQRQSPKMDLHSF